MQMHVFLFKFTVVVSHSHNCNTVVSLDLWPVHMGSVNFRLYIRPLTFVLYFQVGTPSSKSSTSKYQEHLFSGPRTKTYSTTNIHSSNSATVNVARSKSQSPASHRKLQDGSPRAGFRPSTPKRGAQKVTPSYVDESLFGPSPLEADFQAPWDDGKKTVFVMDATDYKLQQKLKEQRERGSKNGASPGKSGPMKASHNVLKAQHGRNKSAQSRAKFTPSHVDELLFGGNSPMTNSGSSWQTAPPVADIGPDYDPLNTGRMSVSGSRAPSREGRPPSPGRLPSSRNQQRPASPASRPGSASRQNRHKPSFVDESLFGPRPVEADFPAPWEDVEAEKRRGRPHIFDGTDHRVTVYHQDSRPSSAQSNRTRPRSASARGENRKPAPWR